MEPVAQKLPSTRESTPSWADYSPAEHQFKSTSQAQGKSYQVLGEVTLNTSNHVVIFRMGAFSERDRYYLSLYEENCLRNDTKGVVFHDRRAADAAKETLLHSALEADDRNFGRGLNEYRSR